MSPNELFCQAAQLVKTYHYLSVCPLRWPRSDSMIDRLIHYKITKFYNEKMRPGSFAISFWVGKFTN